MRSCGAPASDSRLVGIARSARCRRAVGEGPHARENPRRARKGKRESVNATIFGVRIWLGCGQLAAFDDVACEGKSSCEENAHCQRSDRIMACADNESACGTCGERYRQVMPVRLRRRDGRPSGTRRPVCDQQVGESWAHREPRRKAVRQRCAPPTIWGMSRRRGGSSRDWPSSPLERKTRYTAPSAEYQ